VTVIRTTTVAASLTRAAREHGAREAIVIGAERLTHAQVLDAARRYARALAGHGVRVGDHVGILMPNCVEYLLLFYGCALIGARPVHFNARYKRDELRYVIADSDVTLLFTSALQRQFTDFAALLTDLYPPLRTWRAGEPLRLDAAPLLRGVFQFHATAGGPWPGERVFFDGAAIDPPENEDPEQIALIMYTSGTTANPKACLLSHRALETTGRAMMRRWNIDADDRLWDPLPFFHMSTMLPLAACRDAGATFIAQTHFEPGASLREIVDERATILFPSFPTLTNELFEHPQFDPNKLARVRVVNNVGPPDLLRRFAALLPTATHVSAYGLTEAGGVVAFHALTDTPRQRAETCGHPFDGVEMRVVDPETLDVLPAETRGELQIRGPTLFSGYYKDEAKTRATLSSDGWLRTGDLGALTADGRIRYLGRIKDMLKVGGENVAAIEIESHLCTHPAIKTAQVIGAPDDRLQEVAAAFIELHAGARLTADDVVRHCIGRIASYKIPRYVAFVTQWPMSATKIQKYQLRGRLADAVRVEPSRLVGEHAPRALEAALESKGKE
jgi:fatty-acyl-CoA synthase